MPWCPNCKNEYKLGYTVCADCGADLVEELSDEEQDSIKQANDMLEIPDDETIQLLKSLDDNNDEGLTNVKREESQIFVKASDKAENYKSSAYSLLLVGLVGLVFMILLITGVLSINIAANAKIICYSVMIFMFVLFIIIGIKSLFEAKKYAELSTKEDAEEVEIHDWFIKSYTADSLDQAIFFADETDRSVTNDYFKRYDYIKHLIYEKYEDIDSSFAEKLIEDLYAEIYEH